MAALSGFGFGDPHMGITMPLTSWLDLQCQSHTARSFVCLETLSMSANSWGKALSSRKLWSVVCKSVFFPSESSKKKAHNSDFNLHSQSFCVGSSKCMLSLFELIFNIDFYFTLVIGLPIYWLITKHTPCSREKAVDISVSQSSLQNCYKFPSIPVEIYVHFMCSLWF